MGLLFRTVTTTEQKDTDEVKVFYRMVMPNINIRRVDINRLTDIGVHNSVTKAIVADAEALEEMLPNLDTKFSILPYKLIDDGPHKNKASLFSFMGISFDNKYEPHIATDYYADDLSEEDVKTFLDLFKIESNTKNPLDALQLYLQKYSSLKTRDE
jgi:hypothetical protein